MDELIDIVDENDFVIGQELKYKCHKERILHRSASILTFKSNSFKEILLQKRSQQKKLKPGKLCLPGGHLQLGETYLEGAKREFFEEMYNSNFENKKLQFDKLFKIKKLTDVDYEFMTLFRTISDGPFTPDPIEVESYFFEDIKEVIKKIEKESENYTNTAIFIIKEYERRFL